ncbi:MAG TPA: hypothetical protein VLJ18_03970 [Thermoanaerobaculia bacterium]|nr:hypothetical protein [Thermoanaerobaculia bacterium]
MKTTRKNFLFTVAAGLAGAAMRPLSAANVPVGAMGPASVARNFGGLVGKTFRVQTGDGRGSIDVVLETFDERPASNGTHQFSLTFVAPGGERLAEGTYTVEQERMGRFPLFVTPTRRDGQGRTFFRADFNLLLKK